MKNRLEHIREQVKNEKKVTVSELSKIYKVTEETIRRDLEKLEKEGLKSYTMKQDKLTAVVCGVSSDEKESQQVQQKLKALKYSYIPKNVTVENSDVVKLIDEQAYDKALERIGK